MKTRALYFLICVWAEAVLINGYINSHDKFLAEHKEPGVVWMKVVRPQNYDFILACVDGSLSRWRSGISNPEPEILQPNVDDDLQCYNCMIQGRDVMLGGGGCPEENPIPIKSIRRPDNKIDDEVKRRTIQFSGVTSCANPTKEPKKCVGSAESFKVTETLDYTFNAGVKFTTKGKVGVPLIAESELALEVSAGGSIRSATAQERMVIAPSQTVEASPGMVGKTTWVMYKVTKSFRYKVDMVVDEDQRDYNSERFKEFRRLLVNSEFVPEEHLYNEKTGIYVDLSGNNTIICNVPVTETIVSYETDVVHSLEVPVSEARSHMA